MRAKWTIAASGCAVGLAFLSGCSASHPPPSGIELPPDRPMVLSISDDGEYGARAILSVYRTEAGGAPVFSLDVEPEGRDAPRVSATIDAADARDLLLAAMSGGAQVPYGVESQLLAYRVAGEEVNRRPETIQITISDAMAHVTISMGPVVGPPGVDGARYGSRATAELHGRLDIGCSDVVDGVAVEDIGWSTEFCSGISTEYGLNDIREAL